MVVVGVNSNAAGHHGKKHPVASTNLAHNKVLEESKRLATKVEATAKKRNKKAAKKIDVKTQIAVAKYQVVDLIKEEMPRDKEIPSDFTQVAGSLKVKEEVISVDEAILLQSDKKDKKSKSSIMKTHVAPLLAVHQLSPAHLDATTMTDISLDKDRPYFARPLSEDSDSVTYIMSIEFLYISKTYPDRLRALTRVQTVSKADNSVLEKNAKRRVFLDELKECTPPHVYH